MIETARFWIYINGDVARLSVPRGVRVTVSEGGETEEGWSYSQDTYTFDGEVVRRESEVRALDCDGRLDTYCECECRVENLTAGYTDRESAVTFPDWDRVDSSQRDYSAEAMGY